MQQLHDHILYKEFDRKIKTGNIRLSYNIQETKVCAKVIRVDTNEYSAKCCDINKHCDIACAMNRSKLWAFYNTYKSHPSHDCNMCI